MSTVLHANCDTACVTRREAPAAHPKLVLATKGGAAIWWTEARNAGRLLCAAKDGDIPKAAALLGIVATDHATVLARAGAALARLDARLLASAPRRRPRIPQSRIPAASLAGPSRRPTLPTVLGRKGARLQRALVAVAAGDRPGIVARVFGGEGACHRATSLMLPLSTICSTPASVIFCRIQGVSCVEYAHGPDKRLDRRKTPQISVDVAGQHSRVCLCHPACGGPFLRPRHLEWVGCRRKMKAAGSTRTDPAAPTGALATKDALSFPRALPAPSLRRSWFTNHDWR